MHYIRFPRIVHFQKFKTFYNNQKFHFFFIFLVFKKALILKIKVQKERFSKFATQLCKSFRFFFKHD